jgi:23S rRNA (cytosine1962-C5)-methyltransferase
MCFFVILIAEKVKAGDEMKVQVKKRAASRFRKAYPLVQEEDLVKKAPTTEEWIEFTDQNGQFVGKGYLGKQNKGIGWILSQKDQAFDLSFFEQLFTRAKEYRKPFFADELTTAFRLFNGEGDGIGGLIIDYYDGYAVFSWYNETLYSYRNMLVEAFKKSCPEIAGIYEKIRFDAQDLPESSHVFGEKAPEPLIVKENGINFAVYLNEGLMTGIFLDQKEVRGALAEGLALGKTVLNMFSYTGAFSVAAAMGGAAETTSVDLAKRSLKKTQEQFQVNGLSLENHKIVVMDVFDYFKYAVKKGFTYDMIVLDPPSFARNKKKVFRVAKNYGELVRDSIDILEEDGILITSANTANLPAEQFQKMIEEEFDKKNVDYVQQASYRLPADFRTISAFEEGNYLKVFIYKIKK